MDTDCKVVAKKKYHATPEKFKTKGTGESKFDPDEHPETVKKMAVDILRYLMNKDMFYDVILYYRQKDKWISCASDGGYSHGRKRIDHVNRGTVYTWFERDDDDPNDYFEFNGNVISISFEGPLCGELNGYSPYGRIGIGKQLQNYLSHYGLYFELGDHWNLSVYES